MIVAKQPEREIELRILGDSRGFKRYSKNLGVYILKSGDYYKIGHSKDLLRRIDSLLTGNPVGVEIILWVMTSEAKKLETILHEFMAEKRHTREWFKLEDEDVKKIFAFISKWWLEN